MSPLLVGWLVLMAKLDGVELVVQFHALPRKLVTRTHARGRYEGLTYTSLTAEAHDEGRVVARQPMAAVALPMRCEDPVHVLDDDGTRRKHAFIREERDHTSSEPSSYDDGVLP